MRELRRHRRLRMGCSALALADEITTFGGICLFDRRARPGLTLPAGPFVYGNCQLKFCVCFCHSSGSAGGG